VICQIENVADLRILKSVKLVPIFYFEPHYALNMQTTNSPPTDSPATPVRQAQVYSTRFQLNRQTLTQPQPNASLSAVRVPTVFVVDDDPEMRESLELLLLAETFRVEAYESADAFWDVFDAGRHGCVILDLRMPGMGGLALLERLAERDHGLTVIVVSASADQAEKRRAKELGAIEFMPKPYDTKKLLATIREQFLQ
jgi:CheY-like chemotaxis protein